VSRLNPLDYESLDEGQRRHFDNVVGLRGLGDDGRLGGPFDAMVLAGGLGRNLGRVGNSIRTDTVVDRRFVELAILVAGQFWKAQFEWWAHEPMAREAGVPDEVIAAIKTGADPVFADARDEACYRLCRALHVDHQVDDATYSAAAAHFDEVGVVELIATSGYYTLISMLLNTHQITVPEGQAPPF
jgi:4-carboxymuconolactone decarboxylase